jgi:dipeptidase E
MKLLLTSSGITNASIEAALVDLLGKPVSEATALLVPTGIYPFSVGPQMAARLVRGEVSGRLADLGWKSVGLLELTALPSLDREVWVPLVQDADAILVWGGDPVYLAHWMRETDLSSVLGDTVYVGTSAGAMATGAVFAETYTEPRRAAGTTLSSQEVVFDGGEERTLLVAEGMGLVDFAVIPHYGHPDHADASFSNAETWAACTPAPTYAIDDQTALQVVDGVVEVVSEGSWKHLPVSLRAGATHAVPS